MSLDRCGLWPHETVAKETRGTNYQNGTRGTVKGGEVLHDFAIPLHNRTAKKLQSEALGPPARGYGPLPLFRLPRKPPCRPLLRKLLPVGTGTSPLLRCLPICLVTCLCQDRWTRTPRLPRHWLRRPLPRHQLVCLRRVHLLLPWLPSRLPWLLSSVLSSQRTCR
jgi:hypothetical protein